MTLNSFRARFSGILEALEEVAEPAQGNTKTGSTSAYAKEPIKKRLVANQILGTDTSPMHFLVQKLLPKRLKGLSDFFL